MRYAWLGLPLLLLAFVLGGVLAQPTELFAYSRTPTGDPAQEPITVGIDANVDASGNCASNYEAVAFYTAGYTDTLITDWKPQATTNDWTDLTCGDLNVYSGGIDCSVDWTVYQAYVLCNALATNDGNWQAYQLTEESGFTWKLLVTETLESASATIRAIEENANAITFGIAMLVLLVGAGAGWFSIKNT